MHFHVVSIVRICDLTVKKKTPKTFKSEEQNVHKKIIIVKMAVFIIWLCVCVALWRHLKANPVHNVHRKQTTRVYRGYDNVKHALITLEQTPWRSTITVKSINFFCLPMLLNKFPLSFGRWEYYACTPVIFNTGKKERHPEDTMAARKKLLKIGWIIFLGDRFHHIFENGDICVQTSFDAKGKKSTPEAGRRRKWHVF